MTLTPTVLAVALLAVAVGGLTAALVATLGTLRQVRRSLGAAETQLVALRRDVEASTAIGVRAGERLRKLEQAGGQLADRLAQLELRGDGRPYDHAIAMVRDGADAERLVRNFGLSRGEADLVALVHGRRRAS
jgi:hypothetical protein